MRPIWHTIFLRLFLSFLLGAIAATSGAPLRGQSTGGTLRLAERPVGDVQLRTRVISVSLENYTGPPLLACQFNVVSAGAGRILSVKAGASLADSSVWTFASSQRGETVRAVFCGPGIVPGTYSDIARVVVELTDLTNEKHPLILELQNVLGAHGTGDDARVVGGMPLRITYQTATSVR